MKHIKKKIVSAAIVLVLICFLTSGSGIKGDVEVIVRERIDIMNGYFCGQINYYDAIEKIEKVESGRLLEEDILAMREYFQTDIEEVTEYEIRDIEITAEDEELICAVVTIDWNVYGTDGKETIQGIYSTILEKCEKSYKLVQFF